MSLKSLSHIELNQRIQKLFQRERELLSEILLHIQECDRRKLYLELGYANLFSYLTKFIGYSEGAAQRRIDASRLMSEIPEVQGRLASGQIQLSQISLIQKVARQKSKQLKAQQLTPDLVNIKIQALQELEKKSHQDSERIVSDLFNLPIQHHTKSFHQKDESVRIELTLSKMQAEKLQKTKELFSHLIPDGNLPELLDHLMTLALTQKLAATVAVKRRKNENGVRRINKTLTVKVKKQILERDRCCQFVSSLTGQKCGSTWQLQVDHLQPKWANGSNAPENLTALCGQHNRLKYRKEAGIERH